MIKFLLFSDFHYSKKRYPITVNDLEKILKRGHDENVDFVLQGGDFCVDALDSPEIFEALLNNKFNLPVYGVCGNHELEILGNTMDFITPRLCNREVNKPYPDASYWYFDINQFRFIGLDTNYSYDPVAKVWEHVQSGNTMGKPGNTNLACMCPEEWDWYINLLDDAKEKGLKVITLSHHALSGCFNFNCGNAPEIREILPDYKHTAVMYINGDLHAEYYAVIQDVVFYSMTSSRYLDSNRDRKLAYPEDATFEYFDYDENGKLRGSYQKPYSSLTQPWNYYCDEPISAIVTINDDGIVTIDGFTSNWMYGITPVNNQLQHPHEPYIVNRKFKLDF